MHAIWLLLQQRYGGHCSHLFLSSITTFLIMISQNIKVRYCGSEHLDGFTALINKLLEMITFSKKCLKTWQICLTWGVVGGKILRKSLPRLIACHHNRNKYTLKGLIKTPNIRVAFAGAGNMAQSTPRFFNQLKMLNYWRYQ